MTMPNNTKTKNVVFHYSIVFICLLLFTGFVFAYNCTGDCENGSGTITLDNGDIFEGDFENGKPEGRGTYIKKNGDKYTGAIKDGKLNGKGKYKLAS